MEKRTFSLLFFIATYLLFFLLIPKDVFAAVYHCDCGPCPAGNCCVWCEPGPTDCRCGCNGCSSCGGGCGGGGPCFTADTPIKMSDDTERSIADVQVKKKVKSFDPEIGEVREATVSSIHKRKVEGYYILKTESGKEVKVTAEHPILAVKQEEVESSSLSDSESGGVRQIIRDFIGGVWGKVENFLGI